MIGIGLNQFGFLVFVFLLLCLNLNKYDYALGKEYQIYGEKCTDSWSFSECSIGLSMRCSFDAEKGYKICSCLTFAELQYDRNAEINCEFPASTRETCKNHAPCPDDQVCHEEEYCICKNDTLLMINKKCYQYQYKKPLEQCYVGDMAHLCDYRNYTSCINKKCVCFKDYYYNKTSETCQLKSDSLGSAYGSKNYKAKVEEYCLIASDCADPLRCHEYEFKCTCPRPCKYLKEDGVCDCGYVKLEASNAVIIVGVLLGLFSVAMWIKLICKTYRKRKVKHREPQRATHDADPVEMNRISQYSDEPIVVEEAEGKNQIPEEQDLPPSYSEAMANQPKGAGIPPTFFPPPTNTGSEFSPWKTGGTSPDISHPESQDTAISPTSPPYPATQTNTSYPLTPQTNTPVTQRGNLPDTVGQTPTAPPLYTESERL